MKCSCNCDCNSDSKYVSEEVNCPECKKTSKQVTSIVARNLLKKEVRQDVNDEYYFLCTTSDCNISYFSKDLTKIFTHRDVKRPIWFKNDANPIIACYCNSISKEMIFESVQIRNLTSWKNIVDYYKPKRICACDKLNPTSECCTPFFYQLINEALKEIGKKPVKVPDNCCED